MRFKCKHLDFGDSAVFLFAFSFFLFFCFILFFGKTAVKNAAGFLGGGKNEADRLLRGLRTACFAGTACGKVKHMASTREYLWTVLEGVSGLEEVSYRAMMGEFILTYR